MGGGMLICILYKCQTKSRATSVILAPNIISKVQVWRAAAFYVRARKIIIIIVSKRENWIYLCFML